MQSKIKVSIITPNLNQGKFLGETINSVVNQAGDFELEYIIVDGQSADNSLEIIKKYAEKYPFIKWVSEKDSGQAQAINKGFKMASGEVINWLCADDLFLPGALQKVSDFFKKNESAKVVFGQNQFIDRSGKIFRNFKARKFSRAELIKRWNCVYHKFNIAQPSVFIRSEILREVGFIDEQNRFCLDYEWYLRINKKYDFYFIDQILSKSRFHEGCKSIKFKNEQYKESINVSRKYWNENFLYYFSSYLFNLPYIFACFFSAKLRRKSLKFNKLMNFLKGS
jgi:glycosyltransferase involved in cell wall biosynthesis